MLEKSKKLIVILGPTASGKTDLAIKLAKKFNGEIISADSRQIYKGMNIGTAKPRGRQVTSDKKQEYLVKGIPHYMTDIRQPRQKFNVAIFKKMALEAINDVQKQKKLPFLVGGTGLYIKSVVDNVSFPAVPPQKTLRRQLDKKTEKELFKIYQKLDPEGAVSIDKKNRRRLIRAIEVSKITGQSFWKQRKKGKPLFDVLTIGIKLPKKEVEKRIKRRVEKMFKLGLEKEVEKLVEKNGWKIAPLQTIGYQEWKDYFKRKIDKIEVKKKIVLHTLQFSKRQMTWFKKDKRIKWIKNYKEAEKVIKNFLK